MMNKILIANRGEIACRIIRTAQKMNIKTVGLYNDADRDAKHTSMVDEAYYIGPNTLSESYLNMDKILNIAKRTGSNAIHPGYGFLSENWNFVDMLENNNIIFIGPPSKAISAMGNKSESKNVMQNANVPVVKGYHGSNQEDQLLFQEAKKIGFPVLIKAVLGGGGKGMRTVFKEEDFFDMLNSARREALKSFSDDNMLVEKFIQKPKHIEVQIFGDKYANYVHLFERDWSIQRRHQKIIEEAPSFLSPDKRNEIGLSAIRAAEAVGYYNAGTVEFIYDTITNEFFFMEMNTRLQVEHPISEEISGQDFVEWQIRVARGEKLPLTQDDLAINGHSIESRIYAEDPDTNFLPQSGTLRYLREPNNRESAIPDQDVRVDTGVRQGDEVSIYFDPMVSKLIVHGKDRNEAIQKMHNALSNYKIVGLKNNITFLRKIWEEKAFIENNYDTDFIGNYRDSLFEYPFTYIEPFKQDWYYCTLIKLMIEKQNIKDSNQFNQKHVIGNPWFIADAFRINHIHKRQMTLTDNNNTEFKIDIRYIGTNQFELKMTENDDSWYMNFKIELLKDNYVEIESDTSKSIVEYYVDEDNVIHTMRPEGGIVSLKMHHENFQLEDASNIADLITAPMPGNIVKIFSKLGDKVTKGQSILSLESMKMEYIIKAERDAVVKSIHIVETEFVQAGTKLVEFESAK